MPAELSQIITNLEEAGLSVAHSGRANAARVAARLDAIHAGGPGQNPEEGAPKPDFLTPQIAVAEIVEYGSRQLLRLDEAHICELVEGREQREEREAAFDLLASTISAVKDAWEGVYGPGSSRNLFCDVTEMPTDPVKLRRLGTRIRDCLLDEGFVEQSVQLEGWPPPDRAQLAAGLERPLERLSKAIDGVSWERKGSRLSLLDKHNAIEAYRRTLRFAAGFLGSLYGLAGLDNLADSVLPKRRATRGSSSQDADTPPANGSDGASLDGESPNDDSPEGESPDGGSPDGSSPNGGDDGAASTERNGPIGIVS